MRTIESSWRGIANSEPTVRIRNQAKN